MTEISRTAAEHQNGAGSDHTVFHVLGNGDLGLRYQGVGGRIPHQDDRKELVTETDVHRDVTLTRRAMAGLAVDYMVVFPTPMLFIGTHPQPGEVCLDRGASPGGWSWVLAKLGARVIAVDKAPLAPAVAALPGVETRQESAFGLDPGSLPPVDWLFSDVICYPDRLYALVRRWLESGACRRMVCSVKFQGTTDHAAVARFAALPGATLAHLVHNKHELTLFVDATAR
jgi:hypothetical protein